MDSGSNVGRAGAVRARGRYGHGGAAGAGPDGGFRAVWERRVARGPREWGVLG